MKHTQKQWMLIILYIITLTACSTDDGSDNPLPFIERFSQASIHDARLVVELATIGTDQIITQVKITATITARDTITDNYQYRYVDDRDFIQSYTDQIISGGQNIRYYGYRTDKLQYGTPMIDPNEVKQIDVTLSYRIGDHWYEVPSRIYYAPWVSDYPF